MRQLCSGHVTVFPLTMPSQAGRLYAGIDSRQRGSGSPVLKIAIAVEPSRTVRPSRGGNVLGGCDSNPVAHAVTASSMGLIWMNCVGSRRKALQPCIVGLVLRLAQTRSSRACFTSWRGVDGLLADLLDAESLDEIVGALQVVGVLAVVLEEQLARLRAPARWSRP